MKKVFALLAISSLMVACNNSTESTETSTDTVTLAPETTPEAVLVDSAGIVAPVDTTMAK